MQYDVRHFGSIYSAIAAQPKIIPPPNHFSNVLLEECLSNHFVYPRTISGRNRVFEGSLALSVRVWVEK
jgi:hypothetical protein